MFIRIMPGENYRKRPASWYGELPMQFTAPFFKGLTSILTPDQWYVYSILAIYEHNKLSGPIPKLEDIWKDKCSEYMTLEKFNECIGVLRDIIIDDADLEVKLPLIEWMKEEDHV